MSPKQFRRANVRKFVTQMSFSVKRCGVHPINALRKMHGKYDRIYRHLRKFEITAVSQVLEDVCGNFLLLTT
jgi:hypothetical protein